ncbi:hypothetical protein Nepgr_012174 [Nepenthes gracilis]|uniref:Protein DGS1, mitochondrial n=1 Tax=Nepenthes gracilis TaxID=150966 RepID=A0AAD3XMT8_NEPGR|nr:hypothetical protein Nepgr_012174 [Nepenthes gracilis]
MESPSENGTKDMKTLVSLYSNYIWNTVFSHLLSWKSPILGKISNVYRLAARSILRRRRLSLPLPVPPKRIDRSLVTKETSRIFDALEDILEHIMLNLHNVQKNLMFWESKAEESNAQKLYFFILERGPRAFIDGTVKLLRNFISEDSSMQLCRSASAFIAERIIILDSLRYFLATFLAQLYMEVERCGEDLVTDPQKSAPSLLATINALFSNMEASICDLHAEHQLDSYVGGRYSLALVFEKPTQVNEDGRQWTDREIRDAINLVHRNLQKLNSYLSILVSKHRKPRKVARYWVHYTCGVVGLSVCSIWLIRHSSLVGSSDIDNWISEAKESTLSFWNDHVEQPLLSIRDELFETFRKRHKGVMEVEEVQLTANSLHRMLLAFTEQTKGQNFPQNASDQEMLEIVMSRYEKELMHPIQNLLGGELARALLIQVQKLKLDIETAMLELEQILKANEINFAILAALPAFFLSFLLLMLVRSWIMQDRGAQGRGRIARVQRRLLIVEVEKKIMQYQSCLDLGQEQDAQCMYGLMLYCLDRLYHAVERHAKATGEWQWLRQDIIELGKPGVLTAYKLTITSRMDRVYDCLLPPSKP